MTDEDRRILEFAKLTWRNPGARDSAIYTNLGMSPTRYWQVLGRLQDDPEAYIAEPMLMKRLGRLRVSRKSDRPRIRRPDGSTSSRRAV